MSGTRVDESLKRGGGGAALLHGSDVANKREISIKVTDVRVAPDGFNSPIILDIVPVNGKAAWAVNKTNIKALAKAFAVDDLAKLKGKSIKLLVVPTRNPKSGEMTPSLFVADKQKR